MGRVGSFGNFWAGPGPGTFRPNPVSRGHKPARSKFRKTSEIRCIRWPDRCLCQGVERSRTGTIGLTGVIALAALIFPLGATTLLQLTLNDLITMSTGIVQAQVTGVRTDYRGSDIYTYYQLTVSEDWRSSGLTPTAPTQIEVAVPGGVVRGVRQTVAGAPTLTVGQQYVVFLWTSRSGLTQVIGLSQGLFQVQADAKGNLILVRPASGENMISQSGSPVTDQAMTISLAALRARTRSTLGVSH